MLILIAYALIKVFDIDVEFKIRISRKLPTILNIDFEIDYDLYNEKILILILNFYETIQECWFWYWINHVHFKIFDIDIDYFALITRILILILYYLKKNQEYWLEIANPVIISRMLKLILSFWLAKSRFLILILANLIVIQ